MTHTIHDLNQGTSIIIQESAMKKIKISISNYKMSLTHSLSPLDLKDFIDILMHIQKKKTTSTVQVTIKKEIPKRVISLLMEKAITIIENKIIFLERYAFLNSFKTRISVMKDILRELKEVRNV
jgi:hypothetical protein